MIFNINAMLRKSKGKRPIDYFANWLRFCLQRLARRSRTTAHCAGVSAAA